MRCEGCEATIGRWSPLSLCPACHAVAGAPLLPAPRRFGSSVWLWNSSNAQAALSSGSLSAVLRAYRAATGVSQRQLGEVLGYDPTYISMIETGRRDVTDIATRLRVARHLGLPPHTLGVTDPDNADVAAMLQFGESTLRLATLARQSGHGTEAVNELWPLVARLEARAAHGLVERDVLTLLIRARAELGVSLGYILPEERLVTAARWTGRALLLAERAEDPRLLAHTLRVHGNELRKVGHPAAAVVRLQRAAELTQETLRGPALVQLARAAGELGDPQLFDQTITRARQAVETEPPDVVASSYALHEVHLRGLIRTDRGRLAATLLDLSPTPGALLPPQWQAILQATVGEVLLTRNDHRDAQTAFERAVTVAQVHRLPH
ncbi:MAG: helix-turn-helix domain-containing protein [Micromonosporaceae bacterium]|nr:helix-turn-helix domain-containing protein [Micromonosporaceae bacterium]